MMLTEWRSISKVAALAISLPTTAFLVYWLLIRKDEDDSVDDQKSGQTNTSRHTTIQVSVPGKAVGMVIGQKGANIKKIQEESGAKVTFSDRDADKKDEEDRTVFIRGDTESAQKAEVMIRQVIADMPVIVTEEVLVPVYCLGRLIGRGGETIRHISRSSHCKIFIDRSQDSKGPEVPRVVTITGAVKDIKVAKGMIEEKVAEEEEFRAKMAVKGANREQRKSGKKPTEEVERKERVSLTSRVVDEPKELWDGAGDGGRASQVPSAEPVHEFMEVFVSAVEHAGHFWLQMVNRASLNLDKMTDDMSAFYSNAETSQKYHLTEVKPGDIVAAPFFEDNSWYRARVEGFEEGKVDLYYIDYGDNGLVEQGSLRELKPEYLSLPVQAIECKLANVQPTGEEWSEESCELFEQLTHCAEWKILSARTVSYVPEESGQWPCVQLVDNTTTPPTDVAAELVAKGLAVWDTPPVSSHSPSADSVPPSATGASTSETVRPGLVPDLDPHPS